MGFIINDIPPIKEWHEYVEAEPKKHSEHIKRLKGYVERLAERDDIEYSLERYQEFVDFCALFRHSAGRFHGQTFAMSREQRYFAACVLGIITYDEELDMHVRYFLEAVLIVGRKFGKSTFISLLALYMLMMDDEPSAQVWCLATIKTQAAIVYEACKKMLRSSEVLTPPDNQRRYWRTMRDKDNSEMLLFPATDSFMKPAGRNSQNMDGLNPSAIIIDELGAITDRNLYDVMTSATGARTQPLTCIISTANFVRENIYDAIVRRCRDLLDGKTQERLFPVLFMIDDDDDPDDRSCWIKANPGIPDARPTMRYLEGEYQKAKNDPAQMPSFLAKHLNRASGTSVVYFDLHTIDQCADDMSADVLQDKYAVGGVDLSETTDLCCASALIPLDGKLHLFQRYFIARNRLEQNAKRDKMAYESFVRTGASDPLNDELLHISEGSFVNRRDVAAWFQMLAEEYGVTFWKIGGDRWHFADWVVEMEEVGFPREDGDIGVVFEVAQGAKTLSAPMKETRALFNDGKIVFSRHNGLFRWCVTNTAAKIDSNNEIAPDKRASRARIDGYSSFLNAYVAYKRVADDFSVYQS